MTKIVLLDVDGVIFRHPATFAKVHHRIEQFVSKKTRGTIEDAKKRNQFMYKHFGHTHIGLQKLYQSNLSLKDFNDFVYNEDILKSVYQATYNIDVLHDLVQLQSFLRSCAFRNIPVYMFSNAPRVWCKTIQSALHIAEWIPSDRIITCDHEVFQNKKQLLKPQRDVYDTMQNYLRHEYRHDNVELIFVDDSMSNLIPVIDSPVWRPVLFGENTPMMTSRLYQAHSFDEIHCLLD